MKDNSSRGPYDIIEIKKVLAFILAVIDVTLLIWVTVAAVTRGEVIRAEDIVQYGAREGLVAPENSAAPGPQAVASEHDAADVQEAYGVSDAETAAGPQEAMNTEAPEETTEPVPVSLSPEQLSTYERPAVSDFWWYINGVYWTGIPDNAEYITSVKELLGGWKVVIWYDYLLPPGEYSIEYANAEITTSGDKVLFVLDPYLIYPKDEVAREITDEGKTIYRGSWEDGGFSTAADEAGTITVTDIYTAGDGRQYMIGNMVLSDGSDAMIALVRP